MWLRECGVTGDEEKAENGRIASHRSASDIHSWTRENETSNALLYMGIMANAEPPPNPILLK
jgi:hypothetical protein